MNNRFVFCMFVCALCLICAGSIFAQSSPIYPDRLENEYEEVLGRAERLAKEGKWSTAVVQYQTVLEKNLGKVWYDETRSGVKSGGKHFYYVGAADVIGNKLRQMPPEGKQTYRTLYDFQAQAIFTRAAQERSEAKLLDIVLRYPITSVAPDCLLLLGDIRFERGEIMRAIDTWSLAQTGCEPEDRRTPELKLRLSCAYAYIGNGEESEKYFKDLVKPPSLPVEGGQDLGTILKKIASESAFLKTEAQNADWTNLLKNPQANMRNLCSVTHPTRSFLFQLPSEFGGWSQNPRAVYNPYFQRQYYDPYAENNNWDRSHLIKSDNLLIGRTAGTIFGFDLKTNFIVWKKAFSIVVPNNQRGVQLSFSQPEMAFSGGRVYACFGRQLVCLEAATGNVLWQREFPAEDAQPNQSTSADYSTGPLVVGNKVFVGINRVTMETSEARSSLLCVTAENGKIVRQQLIGSRSTMEDVEMRGRFRGNPIQFRSAPLPLIARDGDIFFANNFSMMARVSAEGGEIRWLLGYNTVNSKIWIGRSPIFDGERVYVAAEDGTVVLALNWEDGSPAQIYEIKQLEMGKNNQLIGVRNGQIILGGRYLRGLAYDESNKQLAEIWNLALGGDPQWGQAVWSEKYLYVPTQRHLLVVEINGKETRILDKCPIERVNAYPGNLIADRDHVYSLSDQNFQIFEDTAPLLASIEATLAKKSNDHVLLYNKGQCLIRTDKIAESIDVFQKAYEAVPKPEAADSKNPVKQVYLNGNFEKTQWMIARRIYELSYIFSFQENKDPKNVAHALKYLELARKYATNDVEKAAVYRELSNANEKAGKIPQAAEMLKEMILLPLGTSVRDGAIDSSAYVMGRARLAALARKAGKSSAALLENNDVPPSPEQIKAMKFEDLWKIYSINPDSKRCQAVLPALAEKFRAKDDYAAAYSLLREAWDNAPSSVTGKDLLDELEKRAEWGVARQLLFEAREKIGAQPAPQGGNWKQFADRKLSAEPYLSASNYAPEFKLSAGEKYFYKFPHEINTNTGNYDCSQFPNSLMAAGSNRDQLTVVDVDAGKMIWQKATRTYTHTMLFDKYLMLLGSGTRVFARDTGAEIKSLPIYSQSVLALKGKFYVSSANLNELFVFNGEDMKELARHNWYKIFGSKRGFNFNQMRFYPVDDSWILYWTENGVVTGVNINDGKAMAMTQLGGQAVWANKAVGRNAWFWKSAGNVRTFVSVNVDTGQQTVLGELTGYSSIPKEIINLPDKAQLHITPNSLDKVGLEGSDTAPHPKKIWSSSPNDAVICNSTLVTATTAYALLSNQKLLVEINLKDGAKRSQTKLLDEQNVTFDNLNNRGSAISFSLLLHSGRYLVYKMALAPKERYFGTEPSFCRVVVYDKMLHQNVWQRDFVGLAVCGVKSWKGAMYLLTSDGNLYRYGE